MGNTAQEQLLIQCFTSYLALFPTETPFLKAGLQFGAVCGLYKPFTLGELLFAATKALG